jgi:hypothetical protein
MTFGKDKWDKAYERVVLTEDKTGFKNTQNMFGFGDNLPINEGFGDWVKKAGMYAGGAGLLAGAGLYGGTKYHDYQHNQKAETHSEVQQNTEVQQRIEELKNKKMMLQRSNPKMSREVNDQIRIIDNQIKTLTIDHLFKNSDPRKQQTQTQTQTQTQPHPHYPDGPPF